MRCILHVVLQNRLHVIAKQHVWEMTSVEGDRAGRGTLPGTDWRGERLHADDAGLSGFS